MADWSLLPTELLQLISQKLNSEFYLLRFRSVCSTWRSSIPNYPRNNHLRFKLPISSFDSILYLLKHTIFLVKPPTISIPNQHQQTLQPWLIRIGPNEKGKTRLWDPLDLTNHSPFNFPHNVLDFNQLSIVDLGHVFLLYRLEGSQNHPYFYGYGYEYFANVTAATCPGELQPLIVTLYNFEVPCMFRPGDDSWMKIPNLSKYGIRDICNFKGRICVVDENGQTVMFGPDLRVDLMAELSYPDTVRLCLVESELLLVNTDDCGPICDCDHDHDVWIDVYKLDEKKKKWVKLLNLGDRVLFLGGRCSFSASASDLGFANGNCVINMNVMSGMSCAIRDLSSDDNRVSPVSDYPDYFNLLAASGVDRERLHWEKKGERSEEGMRHNVGSVPKTC